MYLIGKLWALGVVAFQLLSDNYPFESYHPLEVKKMILGCDFSFKKKIWKNVSADAKSFITHLLTVDEERRPSAEEAMNLPWIKKGRELLASGDLNQSELSSAAACFENLKTFRHKGKSLAELSPRKTLIVTDTLLFPLSTSVLWPKLPTRSSFHNC